MKSAPTSFGRWKLPLARLSIFCCLILSVTIPVNIASAGAENAIQSSTKCEFNFNKKLNYLVSDIEYFQRYNDEKSQSVYFSKEEYVYKKIYKLKLNKLFSDGTYWINGQDRNSFRFSFNIENGSAEEIFDNFKNFNASNKIVGFFDGKSIWSLKNTMIAKRPVEIALNQPLLYKEILGIENSAGLWRVFFIDPTKGKIIDNSKKMSYFLGSYASADDKNYRIFISCNIDVPIKTCQLSKNYKGNLLQLTFNFNKLEFWKRFVKFSNELLDCALLDDSGKVIR